MDQKLIIQTLIKIYHLKIKTLNTYYTNETLIN